MSGQLLIVILAMLTSAATARRALKPDGGSMGLNTVDKKAEDIMWKVREAITKVQNGYGLRTRPKVGEPIWGDFITDAEKALLEVLVDREAVEKMLANNAPHHTMNPDEGATVSEDNCQKTTYGALSKIPTVVAMGQAHESAKRLYNSDRVTEIGTTCDRASVNWPTKDTHILADVIARTWHGSSYDLVGATMLKHYSPTKDQLLYGQGVYTVPGDDLTMPLLYGKGRNNLFMHLCRPFYQRMSMSGNMTGIATLAECLQQLGSLIPQELRGSLKSRVYMLEILDPVACASKGIALKGCPKKLSSDIGCSDLPYSCRTKSIADASVIYAHMDKTNSDVVNFRGNVEADDSSCMDQKYRKARCEHYDVDESLCSIKSPSKEACYLIEYLHH